ncbi:MAG: hypothetical protein ACR2RL_22660 [Gammaproteobacteria bacterium]
MDSLNNAAQASYAAPISAARLDLGLVRLLAQRYGDGQVYLNQGDDPRQYERAVRLGLVSTEGYLTAAGRSLVSRHRAWSASGLQPAPALVRPQRWAYSSGDGPPAPSRDLTSHRLAPGRLTPGGARAQ